ncbi:MAG: hypothetical protein JWR72_3280 [Flavisolibacter sp.]|jgi:carboxyl-terminal processing protease|nr:hypothetical protein [Flavisolibacter sp.]
MRIANVKLALALVAGLGIFSACQKEVQDKPAEVTPLTSPKINDSALLYARDLYLWYSQIPSTFTAQSYADPNAVLEAIRAYSIEPGFSAPVDKWSFAYKQKDWDNVSSGIIEDFGLNIFFRTADDLRVKIVERDSPAGRAGIQRGWRIIKVNGSTDISTSNTDFLVKNVFESSRTSFTFQKPDGTFNDIILNAATYQEHPVILDSVYTAGSRKVGYFALNSFLGDTTEVYNNFQRVFSGFSNQNVQDVIVDLRYNGGGYVSISEKLTNYLVGASANGNVMMTQKFNDKYSQYNETTRINKLGSLNISRVIFIVSNNTASASELLINNLKPYLDVKLVGPSNTHGKPVGFFPVPVGDWYVFPVSFRTVNKNGEGNYFNGIPLDNRTADGLDKNWGDVNEACLASALKYISSGSFRVGAQNDNSRVDPAVEQSNGLLEAPSFKGAVAAKRL